MDGSRFDAWTRRRFGLAASGIATSLLGLMDLEGTAAAKKKRKKKRQTVCCKSVGSLCAAGESSGCCDGLACGTPYDLYDKPETYCCYREGDGPCSVYNDCCYPSYCSGDVCVTNSDRNLKTNFASVDAEDMLARLAALPISTWHDTADDPAVRHIGPMAQDFATLFNVGAGDQRIHPVDGQGVALAAIQGLLIEVDRLRAETATLAARISARERSRA